MNVEYILCHGSGNRFVMVDAIKDYFVGTSLDVFARSVCDGSLGMTADGLLVVVRNEQGRFGMRMFNPDGSEAEMCGNGIRCVARLVSQRYVTAKEFVLFSGGCNYPIALCEDIYPNIPTFGVDIYASLTSPTFGCLATEQPFADKAIYRLSAEARFTAISVGNPHIVATVEHIDIDTLTQWGECVKQMKDEFPSGVNVSMIEQRDRNTLKVTTYERGAGITPSCGTAMTSSATAMAYLGKCDYEVPIMVINRGGAVRCVCHKDNSGRLTTTLIGNATFIRSGLLTFDGEKVSSFTIEHTYANEATTYEEFVEHCCKQ